MNRDTLYLESMAEACQAILNFLEKVGVTEFKSNKMLHSAVVRQLEIIGEAAGQLSQEFRERYPAIPWREMIGMRNRLIHDYMNVDLQLAWETCQQDIPQLLAALQNLLGE